MTQTIGLGTLLQTHKHTHTLTTHFLLHKNAVKWSAVGRIGFDPSMNSFSFKLPSTFIHTQHTHSVTISFSFSLSPSCPNCMTSDRLTIFVYIFIVHTSYDVRVRRTAFYGIFSFDFGLHVYAFVVFRLCRVCFSAARSRPFAIFVTTNPMFVGVECINATFRAQHGLDISGEPVFVQELKLVFTPSRICIYRIFSQIALEMAWSLAPQPTTRNIADSC